MIIALTLALSTWGATVGDVERGLHPRALCEHRVRTNAPIVQDMPLAMFSPEDVLPREDTIHINLRVCPNQVEFTRGEVGMRNHRESRGFTAAINDAAPTVKLDFRKERRVQIQNVCSDVSPRNALYADFEGLRRSTILQAKQHFHPVIINCADQGGNVYVWTHLRASDPSLFPTLAKCGVVCRNRLSHQKDRDKGEYGYQQARNGGEPLGRSVVPYGAVIGLTLVCVIAGVIWIANWAIPRNQSEND